MAVRNITKQLAGAEDLLLGKAQTTEEQIRNGKTLAISKIDMPLIVDAIDGFDLSTVDTDKYRTIEFLGYYTKGDGGGGLFYYDEADTTSEDNGGTILVTGTKRWKRKYSGAVNVKWFGAKGDGAADDTNAIQKAIDYSFNTASLLSSYGYTASGIFIPSGIYKYTGIIIKKYVSITGEGQKTTFLKLYGSNTGIKTLAKDSQSSADNVSNITISNLSLLTGEDVPVSQVQIDITGMSSCLLSNLYIEWCGGCNGVVSVNNTLASSGGPSQWYNTIFNCDIYRLSSKPDGGIGMYLGDVDITKEQVTSLTVIKGRINGSSSGTGISLRGTGNSFISVTLEGLDNGFVFGGDSTRGAEQNTLISCYFEGCDVNIDNKANSKNLVVNDGFVTGGLFVEDSKILFDRPGKYSKKLDSGDTYEIISSNTTAMPEFKSTVGKSSIALTDSDGNKLEISCSGNSSVFTEFFKLIGNSELLLSLGKDKVLPRGDNLQTLGDSVTKFKKLYCIDSYFTGSDIKYTNLPTSDPAEAGRLWNDSGVVKISAG